MSNKRIKLNALQARTLMMLQLLARDDKSSEPMPDSEDRRITHLPHAHGNHMHVGDLVISSRDASGLDNPSVWMALTRKGFVRDNWQQEIVITAEGLAFSTGLEKKFATASDH